MNKTIFIDIDGTLRNNKKEITEETKKSIKMAKEKGFRIIICSGRARKYTENISKECKASEIIIASNGSDVYDYKNQKSIFLNNISNEICMKLNKLSKEYGITLYIDTENGQYTNNKKQESMNVEFYEDFENLIIKSKVIHAHFGGNDFDKMKELFNEVKKIDNIKIGNDEIYCFKDSYFIFISSENSNKGHAIIELCKILDIDLKETIAIGDDYNDIDMFKVAGYTVAMENAVQEIKEIANEITVSNDENGVAKFLNKISENC
ncbi:MAG: HAD family phosphatase [Clostridia bacterium]|nr:HAD family phosphatase [Clostridia bacterium]